MDPKTVFIIADFVSEKQDVSRSDEEGGKKNVPMYYDTVDSHTLFHKSAIFF